MNLGTLPCSVVTFQCGSRVTAIHSNSTDNEPQCQQRKGWLCDVIKSENKISDRVLVSVLL